MLLHANPCCLLLSRHVLRWTSHVQLLRTALLCGCWCQMVGEVQARGGAPHRQEITNVLWALAALDQLQPQHFASLTAMLDEEAVLDNMSLSGARQLFQVAACCYLACSSHALQALHVPSRCMLSILLVFLLLRTALEMLWLPGAGCRWF